MKTKSLLFSVTAKDMEWDFFRAGGAGGQNQNKRSTGVRCRHVESGAVGEARDERSQHQNRKLAFRRCVETSAFQRWLRVEAARREGRISRAVDDAMQPKNMQIEYYTPEEMR